MRSRHVLFLLALSAVAVGIGGTAAKAPDDPTKVRTPRLLRGPTLSKTSVVFAFADDLWTVPREGGEARRLTTDAGIENDPVFSPDGKYVAFTGQYDGNDDVYVVPAAGGEVKRLTYHPGVDTAVGWTPDGKKVLMRSSRANYSRVTKLYTIGLDGGLPEELPLPQAHHGSFSGDGKRLAYVPMINHPARAGSHVAWDKYKGGKQPWIWLADLADSSVSAVPRKDSNDFNPMWVGDVVYFLSDRDGSTTLFAYDTAAKKLERLVEPNGDNVRSANAGPGGIVYETAGGIHLYDYETKKSKPIDVTINADFAGTRAKYVKGADFIASAGLSPTGARAVFAARGEVFTVPASKGDVRNITKSPGVAERDPAWSPDGKHIAYFSDASGEYELHLAPQDGKGAVKKFKIDRPTFFYSPIWSPDSKKIAFTSKKLEWLVLDVESGKVTLIDTNPYSDFPRPNAATWSPDSRWLAYGKQLKSHFRAVFVHSLEAGKSTQLTDGMADVGSVAFDAGGQYLYFTASSDSGPATGSMMSSFDRPVSREVYVVVLPNDVPSPLAPLSDEEKPAANPNVTLIDMKKPGGGEKKDPAKVRIDFADIDQRILALPVPSKNYMGLMPGRPGVVFLAEGADVSRQRGASIPSERPGMTLHRFEFGTKRRAERFLDGVQSATISANGDKLLVRMGGGGGRRGEGGGGAWQIVSTILPPTGPGGAGTRSADGLLNLDAMQVRVEPKEEFRQMFNEVVRIERDFLYDPGAHGLDLAKAKARFERYLPGLGSRHDLNYLLTEMLGGLCLGHVYIQGGDLPRKTGPGGGLLGADFAIDGGRYKITKIYRGENFNPALRAPLTQPGAAVKEGEFVLAIDGEDLKGDDSIFRLLEAKAGKSVTLTVADKAAGGKSREVKVTPVADETSLRHHGWVTDNRKKVAEMTDGKIGYIYLPNTAAAGHERFVREFYPQVGKAGVIIDERFNGGGYLADSVVELLNRKVMNYSATREGEDQVFPRSIFGPKVMIINESAGSGGDYLPYTFRAAKVGTLVGKRTWGGLIGIGGYPALVDGGTVTAPHWGLYFPSGKWDVENAGVAPDVVVEQDPALMRKGRDPQLEKAVEIAMRGLKDMPPTTIKRPGYPNYYEKK